MEMFDKKRQDSPRDNQESGNEQLIANLETYLSAKRERPEFALGIYGDWGIGKTFFIQDYLRRRGTEFCYISLFGVSSISEIESKIFEYENPLLSSPFAHVGIGALLNLAKLNGDENVKTKWDISVLVESIQQEVNNFFARKKRILHADSKAVKKKRQPELLVFDDLERCPLATETILGFLADLLQLRGYPVILVYNKREFDSRHPKPMAGAQIKSDSQKCELDPQVAAQKEKVIGREIAFNPKAQGILRDIYAENDSVCRSIDFYAQVLKRNGNNFRRFRQVVWDFELATENVPATLKAFVGNRREDLQKIYVAATLEMERSSSKFNSKTFLSRQPPDSRGEDNFFSIYNATLSPDADSVIALNLWDMALKTSRFNWGQIERYLESQKEQPAAWRQLWEFPFTSQDTFERSLQVVKKELDENCPVPITVLFHELGLFHAMADQGFIGEDERDCYVETIQSVLDSLYQNSPEAFDFLRNEDLVMASFNGFGLHALDKVIPVLREYKAKAETSFEEKMIRQFASLPSDYSRITAEFLTLPRPVIARYCQDNLSAIIQFLNGGARTEDKVDLIEHLFDKLNLGINASGSSLSGGVNRLFVQELLNGLDIPQDSGFKRGSMLVIRQRLKKLVE